MDPLLITVVGIAIVFAVLILLVLIISFFNVISSKFSKINVKTKKEPKVQEVVEENNVLDVKDNKKTVAIITAALMSSVYSGTNTRFIVKKIKKI